jgi:hypothetical protein
VHAKNLGAKAKKGTAFIRVIELGLQVLILLRPLKPACTVLGRGLLCYTLYRVAVLARHCLPLVR